MSMLRASSSSSFAWLSLSAAMISRMQSAPIARASNTCQGSIMKSLRSTGRLQAARAARKSAGVVPNQVSSVSTERHFAPAAW